MIVRVRRWICRLLPSDFRRAFGPAMEETFLDALDDARTRRGGVVRLLAREIVDQLRSPQQAGSDPFSLLSGREREVLHLIADGLSAKEIAVELKISTKTVEAHRTSLMRKLGVRKATELVRYALRHGLIEP